MTPLELLRAERKAKYSGGLYHLTQIMFAYNNNHIEGSKLTEEQTRYIYEMKSFFPKGSNPIQVDDVVETVNHFRLFDYMLDHAEEPLTESMIKEFHRILKTSTTDSALSWFRVGDYKAIGNVAGTMITADPDQVPSKMVSLLRRYHQKTVHSLEDLVDFHYQFERIHPFQDGNGRVGRMILFKECLKYGIKPFMILDRDKEFYYRGLQEYSNEKGYLIGTCQMAQDIYADQIKRFIPTEEQNQFSDSRAVVEKEPPTC